MQHNFRLCNSLLNTWYMDLKCPKLSKKSARPFIKSWNLGAVLTVCLKLFKKPASDCAPPSVNVTLYVEVKIQMANSTALSMSAIFYNPHVIASDDTCVSLRPLVDKKKYKIQFTFLFPVKVLSCIRHPNECDKFQNCFFLLSASKFIIQQFLLEYAVC